MYTHINESLLQKKLKGNIENIFAKRQNKAMSENGQITDKTQTVSYTHLDVYKRQVVHLRIDIDRVVAAPDRTQKVAPDSL